VFVTPALSLIAVFFFLPVLGGLILSFTDFDIYAIGRPDTTRFMGLGNYAQVLSIPCSGRHSATRSCSCWSAGRSR